MTGAFAGLTCERSLVLPSADVKMVCATIGAIVGEPPAYLFSGLFPRLPTAVFARTTAQVLQSAVLECLYAILLQVAPPERHPAQPPALCPPPASSGTSPCGTCSSARATKPASITDPVR